MVVFGNATRFFGGLKESCIKRDTDFNIVNLGGEGVGKSNGSLGEALLIDPTFSVENVAFEYKKLLHLFRLQNNMPIIADEGVNVLFSREAMSFRNKNLVKELINNRYLNKVGIYNVPRLKFIDTNIRGHRFNLAGISFSRNGERGHNFFFRGSKIPLIISFFDDIENELIPSENLLRRLYQKVKPDFYVKWPKISETNPELWNAYLVMKNEAHKHLLERAIKTDERIEVYRGFEEKKQDIKKVDEVLDPSFSGGLTWE